MADSSSSVIARLTGVARDEVSLQYRTVWDLYLKFYTVFLTINITALGATVQFVSAAPARWIIAITFVVQNVISGITAMKIAIYSRQSSGRFLDLLDLEAQACGERLPEQLRVSPLNGQLGFWAGVGNCVGHAVFIALWISVACLDFRHGAPAGPAGAAASVLGVVLSPG